MKLVKWIEMILLASSLAIGYVSVAHAKETAKEKTLEAGKDLKKTGRKAGRAVSDEACPMVNGKLDCAGKKMKHKVQNAADEVKDKVNAD